MLGSTEFMSGMEHNAYIALVPPGTYSVRREVQAEKRGLTVTFRDGNGLVWQRDGREHLTEVKRTDPATARGLVEGLPYASITRE